MVKNSGRQAQRAANNEKNVAHRQNELHLVRKP